ncbi:MAG TPA: TlpA disulfide reductase family protein [Bryobacteraceae bacterium]|nr:TlpA disulfide reductase family protein [Bryobacteraceae bacterium]
MKLALFLSLLAALPLSAQEQSKELSQAEQQSLSQALSEAGNSPIEFVRAIENHLKTYPNSPKRVDLENALLKTAMDLNDDRRIIEFGERVLKREPDSLPYLERVTTSLLHAGDKASAAKALEHAVHFEQIVESLYRFDKFEPGAGREAAKRKDDFDRGRARGELLLARSHGLLGHNAEAIKFAEGSYAIYASIEGARESAKWLSAAGKDQDAIPYLAAAFTIAGVKSTDTDDASDRARMIELYRKLHGGSEAGLGDVLLKAYDATSAQFAARRARLREIDPNAQQRDPLHFTLSGLDGEKLQLSSLLGKVIVMDFWATWCGPCRQQHPLYDQVKARFKDRDDIVFLSIDADEDHTQVKPFLELQKWTQKVYFEDGLSSLLQVSSLPMTIIYGKKGDVVSRMPGFLPERFVEMLAERIDEALGTPRDSQKLKTVSSQ